MFVYVQAIHTINSITNGLIFKEDLQMRYLAVGASTVGLGDIRPEFPAVAV